MRQGQRSHGEARWREVPHLAPQHLPTHFPTSVRRYSVVSLSNQDNTNANECASPLSPPHEEGRYESVDAPDPAKGATPVSCTCTHTHAPHHGLGKLGKCPMNPASRALRGVFRPASSPLMWGEGGVAGGERAPSRQVPRHVCGWSFARSGFCSRGVQQARLKLPRDCALHALSGPPEFSRRLENSAGAPPSITPAPACGSRPRPRSLTAGDPGTGVFEPHEPRVHR